MPPSTGQGKPRRRPFDPERQARLERHRSDLMRLTIVRKAAATQEKQALADSADLILIAVEDGLSMIEAEDLTELTRPTLYRHVAKARNRLEQNLPPA